MTLTQCEFPMLVGSCVVILVDQLFWGRAAAEALGRRCFVLLTASHRPLSPQMSYSLTRFAIYETVRDMMGSKSQGPMPFYQKVLLGAFGGGEPLILRPPISLMWCHTSWSVREQLSSADRFDWRVCWNSGRHGECQVTFRTIFHYFILSDPCHCSPNMVSLRERMFGMVMKVIQLKCL